MINPKSIKYLSLLLVFICNSFTEGKGQVNGNASKEENYLLRVKAYADEMISRGRDRYGEISSPLFASALDRETMEIANVKLVCMKSFTNSQPLPETPNMPLRQTGP